MKELWHRLRRPSVSHVELPAEFWIDELPEGDLGGMDASGSWEQVQAACAELIREARRLRQEGKRAATLSEAARKEVVRLVAEAGRMEDELRAARRALADRTEEAERQHTELLCRFAGEVFRYQQMLAHLQKRELDRTLGKEYDRARILGKRFVRLLRNENVLIIDPTGQMPNDDHVEATDYVITPDLTEEIVIETLEPVVVQAGRVIGRGKVVVAVPSAT